MHNKEIGRSYAALLRSDLPSFIAKTFATVDPGARFVPNWHIDLIAEHLEALRAGSLRRLIINMPPRALKSVCVSVAWPAWLLGHDPAARVIAASYSLGLSVKHSLDCRLVLSAPWYRRAFPRVALSSDQNEKHKFVTTQRGFRLATSVGGTVTGEGGGFLIADDLLSPMQALSATQRAQAGQWFEHTFLSRLDDKEKGAVVVVMQRLHPEDLTGHLLKKGGWEHLCLPALATSTTEYSLGSVRKRRDEGEPLHLKRESAAALQRLRREMGAAVFSAQYQQEPLPSEGAMIRPWWLARYDAPPAEAEARIVQSWDTAIKAAAQHDFSACLTFAECENGYYLLDVQRMQAEYPELKRAVLSLAAQWKPHAILIEDKASGQSLLQDLRRETALPVIAQLPRGDKVMRLAACSALIEAGKLHLPRHAPWLAEFEAELLAFPNAPHDDQVDALTQFLGWVRRRQWDKVGVRRV